MVMLFTEFIESKFSKNSSFNNLIFMYIHVYVYTASRLLSPLCKKNFHPLKKLVASIETRVPLVPLTKKPVPRLILNFPFLFSPGGRGLSGGSFSVCIASNSGSSVLRHKDEIRGVTKVDAYVWMHVWTPTVEENPRLTHRLSANRA